MLGATNLISGPNSTEMVIHLGYVRAGRPRLILAGVCFLSPAMLIVLALAWAYASFGTTPQVGWLLYGIKPIVIAIVGQALWTLGRKSIKGPFTAVVFAAIVGLYFAGVNEIALLIVSGLIGMAATNVQQLHTRNLAALLMPLGTPGSLPSGRS